ncbi:arsenic resistance protein [Rarobacter faecitabidus]|uniref:ACR3 family arsenite efflux pump ArsB n=1 Tax=Rarobacter faecitabidus TaxID=13243 RepID=A0A542ZUL9_RARFA|nr:bile acid:sodium symporter [Rarobacter faecitabidus]TQL64011.1 ACR3 family arsenite efflux pump ArsB [Rarobacter faecitabidus]
MTTFLERHQIALYLAAIAVGGLVGFLVPRAADGLELAINPSLIALLYATFLGVPFNRLRAAFADRRFLLTLLVLNFAIAPAVVFALSRFVAHDEALLIGLLLVLLAPCVDYVIVFTRLAGGDWARLLAAAPSLMLVQLLLLPVYLLAFAGSRAVTGIDWQPFAEAFVLLIVLPLGLSIATQWLATSKAWARRIMGGMEALMIPLMVVTLFTVVASQFGSVADRIGDLVPLIPIYAAFAALMPVLGFAAARVARQERAPAIALAMSGTTRNSLVVLPLALALPPALGLAPLAVVTQTLVELIAMVALVRIFTRGGRSLAAKPS